MSVNFFVSTDIEMIAEALNSGNIGVIRTDTLYGVVARANDQSAVERIYTLKHRSEVKSPIVLVRSLDQLFDEPSATEKDLLAEVWPGKVSVILPSKNSPQWIQRGNQSVAYRMPDVDTLRQLLSLTGPLVAPSANPEGEAPAMSVEEARAYFHDRVDFYVDTGATDLSSSPSQLIRLDEHGAVQRLR